jgi:hypothetical protein
VLALLKYNDQISRSIIFLKFGKKRAHEESGEPEPEPKERTMTVTALTGWLGVTGAGVEVSEHSDWNKQRAAATGQGTVGCLLAVTRFGSKRT